MRNTHRRVVTGNSRPATPATKVPVDAKKLFWTTIQLDPKVLDVLGRGRQKA
jgi:hypothetical protein